MFHIVFLFLYFVFVFFACPAKTMPCHKYPCQGLIVISINTFVLYCWHCIFFHLYSVFVFCEPSQDNVLSQVYKLLVGSYFNISWHVTVDQFVLMDCLAGRWLTLTLPSAKYIVCSLLNLLFFERR